MSPEEIRLHRLFHEAKYYSGNDAKPLIANMKQLISTIRDSK